MGAGGGGFRRLLDLAVDGALSPGLVVAVQLPMRAKLVWACGTTVISRGIQGFLIAEVRGLLGIRVLERERSRCVDWSRGLAQQCEHYNLLVPIVQMGRLRPQEALTQEAGSSFIPGGPGE